MFNVHCIYNYTYIFTGTCSLLNVHCTYNYTFIFTGTCSLLKSLSNIHPVKNKKVVKNYKNQKAKTNKKNKGKIKTYFY